MHTFIQLFYLIIINLLLDNLPYHSTYSNKSNPRPKPAQLHDYPLQTDTVKHKS